MTQTYTGTLEIVNCAQCGVTFGITETFRRNMIRDRGTFYCPNGHPEWFPGKTDVQLREEAEAAAKKARQQQQATLDLLAAEERSHRTTRGHVTRKKKQLEKVRAGVCPVDGCHRHFQNLDRHMETKHPERWFA